MGIAEFGDGLLYEYCDMKIIRYISGKLSNNSYVIDCKKTKSSVVIDIPEKPNNMLEYIESRKVEFIAITHGHYDHIEGYDSLKKLNIPIAINKDDMNFLSFSPDLILNQDIELEFGHLKLRTISTPGHTSGSTCFLVRDNIFTGDTLFPSGPGRTNSIEEFKMILKSISEKLFCLGNDVKFYPGHGKESILRISKEEYSRFLNVRNGNFDLSGNITWIN